MSNAIQNRYEPDLVSPPGETLEEILEEREITQAELALRMGRPKKTINEIIKGKAAITPETSLELERVLGVPASFWNNRERLYREFLAKQDEDKYLKEQTVWLEQIPYKAMIKCRWIKAYQDKVKQLREILNFFAVASPEQWEEIWGKNLLVDYRKSQIFDSDRGAVTAWLRQGEIEAATIVCKDYNPNKFKDVLQKIRFLTIEPPEIFRPEMVRLCAEAGVAVVFVPELPKTRVCGATRWLNSNKALIQLSLRYKTNDHFWFSFFHESGHILLHGKRNLFIEVQDRKESEQEDKEQEANTFAANTLIPSEDWVCLIQSGSRSKESIIQFATSIGIAPGIVVGRLQKEAIIPYSHCNQLKESFTWM